MTPTLVAEQPVRAVAGFPTVGLWLLALIPANVVMLLDLQHGSVRPLAWLARFVPALLLLALVGWAQLRTGPTAIRLRRELRLSLGPAMMLLLGGGAALALDVLSGSGQALARAAAFMTAIIVPTAVVLLPMSAERERGTLLPLLASPLGARAFAEKFAVAALVIVVSWIQLSAAGDRGSELWWFALAGHALPLLTVPTWFFLLQNDGMTLGYVVVTPVLIAVPIALLGSSVAIGCVVVFGFAMLAGLPAAYRRGAAVGPPLWLQGDVPGLSGLERLAPPLLRAALHAQRPAVMISAAGVAGFVAIAAWGRDSAVAPLPLFIFSGCAAMLSPSLAFAEARRVGTLEAELVAQPRRQVFARRALLSGLTTAVLCVALPGALVAGVVGVTGPMVMAWCVAMLVLWSVGLAASVHQTSAGSALVAGFAVAGIAGVGQLGLCALAAWATASWVGGDPFVSRAFLAAALAGGAAVAFAVGCRRFLAADRFEPRIAVAAVTISLLHAAVLGMSSALVGHWT